MPGHALDQPVMRRDAQQEFRGPSSEHGTQTLALGTCTCANVMAPVLDQYDQSSKGSIGQDPSARLRTLLENASDWSVHAQLHSGRTGRTTSRSLDDHRNSGSPGRKYRSCRWREPLLLSRASRHAIQCSLLGPFNEKPFRTEVRKVTGTQRRAQSAHPVASER